MCNEKLLLIFSVVITFLVYKNYAIVEGIAAKPGQFPFVVWIQGCGGALITDVTVVTAAHCVNGATQVTVTLGAMYTNNSLEPKQEIVSSGIKIFPYYNETLNTK